MKFALIFLILLTAVVPVVAQSDEVLRGSQTITSTLASETDEIRYTYQGEVGQILRVYLNSFQFDTLVELYDARGNLVMRNDDGTNTLNSYVYAYLWDDSLYTILVKSSGGAGEYELEIEAISMQYVAFGAYVKGMVSAENERAYYYFEGTEGDVISTTIKTDEDIPWFYFEIYDTLPGRLVGSNDDDGTGLIGPYTLPYTGFYMLLVKGDGLTTDEHFLMRLEQDTLEPLPFESVAQGMFTEENQTHFYYFYGRRTDIISAYVASDVDTNLTLMNGDRNTEILFAEDNGTGFTPEILNFWLPGEHYYYLMVRPTIPGSTGAFSVILAHENIPSLSTGTQQLVMGSFPYREAMMTFEPPATGTYTLSIQLAPETLAPSFRVWLRQNGEEVLVLSSLDLNEAGSIVVEFTLTSTDPMQIKFDNLGGRLLVLEVSIE